MIDCDVSDWIDLPELTSIQLGQSTFEFNDDVSATLVLRSASH